MQSTATRDQKQWDRYGQWEAPRLPFGFEVSYVKVYPTSQAWFDSPTNAFSAFVIYRDGRPSTCVAKASTARALYAWARLNFPAVPRGGCKGPGRV